VSSNADIIRYLRSYKPSCGFFSINEKIETVITDLTISKDDLLMNASKTVRYEVNKCEKEDTLECDKEKRGCDGCYYNTK
jgi:hypothetical protein